jgi:hypothetical protein
MLRVGDKVAPFFNMPQIGVIIEITSISVNTWLVGGSSGVAFQALVKLDDDSHIMHKVDDLRLIERP